MSVFAGRISGYVKLDTSAGTPRHALPEWRSTADPRAPQIFQSGEHSRDHRRDRRLPVCFRSGQDRREQLRADHRNSVRRSRRPLQARWLLDFSSAAPKPSFVAITGGTGDYGTASEMRREHDHRADRGSTRRTRMPFGYRLRSVSVVWHSSRPQLWRCVVVSRDRRASEHDSPGGSRIPPSAEPVCRSVYSAPK